MKHSDKDELRYVIDIIENDLNDEENGEVGKKLDKIITGYINDGETGDFYNELKEYAKLIGSAKPDDYDQIFHNLRRLTDSDQIGWQYGENFKKLLDLELKTAVENNDTIKQKKLIDTYIKLFRIDPVLNSLDDDLKSYFENLEDNTEINTALQGAVRRGSLALIIGAGVTASYVGDWSKLLKKLMEMRVYNTYLNFPGIKHSEADTLDDMQKYLKEHIKTFINDSVNYLERGEYLRYDSSDQAKKVKTEAEEKYREVFFAQQVKRIIEFSLHHRGKKGDQYFIDEFKAKHLEPDQKESTLSAVLKLCIKKNISEIITYNFDTALDRLLAEPKIINNPEPIRVEVYSYRQSAPLLVFPNYAEPDWKTIKIYHVHGVVDEDMKPDELHPLIFSENSYQNYQKTVLNWSNIKLADVQSRCDILCVGFSGDDPNFRALRRFLDETKNNPVMGDTVDQTSMFLIRNYRDDKRRLIDTFDFNQGSNSKYVRACVETYFDMVISYFKKQYKVDIVWSYGFDHMARQICELADL